MKRKAIILTAVVVLSTMVAGVGVATTAPGPTQQAPVLTQQTTLQTNTSDTTDGQTDRNGQSTSRNAAGLPHPVDIPPSQLEAEDVSVDMSTLPANVQSNGEYAVQSSAPPGMKSDGSASIQTYEYQNEGTQLLWPSLDTTGQSGPQSNSKVYFKNYTLRAITPEVEIWVANDLSWPGSVRPTPEISQEQLHYLASEFTNNIEPKETQLYREPVHQYGTNSPLYDVLPDDYYQSADNQSRTVILVDNVRDEAYYNPSSPTIVAGFFSPLFTNVTDRNVMVIDAARWDQRLGGPHFSIESTVAHEYQHLLHSYEDSNETIWINEGLSTITPYLVGYGVPENIQYYERFPSNSLIEWGDQTDKARISILADYGAAGLFQLYGNQQFGTDFIKTVFESNANGIQSIKDALNANGAERDFYSFYQDFSTALVTDGLNTTTDRYQIENVDFDVNTSSEVIYTRDNQTAAYGNAYNPLNPPEGKTIANFSVTGSESTIYQYSFVGIRANGSTEVVHLDPHTFESGGPMSLSQFPRGTFEKIIFTVTWAPENRHVGTVPYGYEVNFEKNEQPPEQNTLRIEGTGSYAVYAFTVSGDVNVTESDGEDEVAGTTVYGAVNPDYDTYTFEGSLEGFYLNGDAKVFLNGERINVSSIGSSLNAVIFEGEGSYATYEFTVTGEVVDGIAIDSEDSFSGNHGEGAITAGQDIFIYSGELKNTNTTSNVHIAKSAVVSTNDGSVILTDEEASEEGEAGDGEDEKVHAVTFRGKGSYVSYEFTVTGEVVDGNVLDPEDSFSGNHGEGATTAGPDTFIYTGELKTTNTTGDVDIVKSTVDDGDV